MSENSMETDRLINGLILLIIVVISVLGFTFNYWIGFSLLFLSLPIFITFRFREFERLTLLLLGYLFLLMTLLVASLVQPSLLDNQARSRIAIIDSLAGAVSGSYGGAILISLVVGIIMASLIVGLFFLLLVTAVAASLHSDDEVSFGEALFYVARSTLGLRLFSLTVEGGDTKGKDKDKKILEKFGGPGRLRIYPGQLVALHKYGQITRIVEAGTTMVKSKEKVKAIIPLRGNTDVQEIDNVLTRDRIAVKVKVAHSAQIENAEGTRRRLAELKAKTEPDQKTIDQLQAIVASKQIIGQEPNAYYLGIAKIVANEAPNAFEATKNAVMSNLRDVFMAYKFEELFQIENIAQAQTDVLQAKIDHRTIAKIEGFILEKTKGYGLGKGVVLKFVDISEVRFPEEFAKKVHESLKAFLEARTKIAQAQANERAAQIDARARVTIAKSAETEAYYQGRAVIALAKAKADADGLREDIKIKGRAEYFRRVLKVLMEEEQSEDTIRAVMQNLASAVSVEDEFKRLFQLMDYYLRNGHRRSLTEVTLERD